MGDIAWLVRLGSSPPLGNRAGNKRGGKIGDVVVNIIPIMD